MSATRIAQAFLGSLLLTTSVRAADDYDAQLAAIGAELAECLAGIGERRVAVYDFTDLQLRTNELGRLVSEELTTELVRQGRARLTVLDRHHLHAIIRDHELVATGFVDPALARKLGKFAGIDTLVTGNVVELEDRIRLTVKALDTETSEIRCATRGDLPRTMALREIGGTAAGPPGASGPGPRAPPPSAAPPRTRTPCSA